MSVESNSGNGMSGRTSLGVEDGLLESDDFDFGFEGTVGGVAGVATGVSLPSSSSGKSSSKTLLPAVFGEETWGGCAGANVESFCCGGATCNSLGATLTVADVESGLGGCVLDLFGLVAAISCFLVVGMFTGSSGLSNDNQSSSSFLDATTPGTRIGEEHLGQTNFCPARLEGALSFFSHFGHAKFKS